MKDLGREEKRLGIDQINLTEFKELETLGNKLPMMFQLKGFNRQERIERRKSQISIGKSGSTNKRSIAHGAVILLSDLSDLDSLTLEKASFVKHLPDPRGMCATEKDLFVGSVDEVRRIEALNELETRIANPWFAFIHSVALSPDQRKLLITSSGFDRIMEINIDTQEVVREWIAWNNGLNITVSSKKKVVTHSVPGLDATKTIVVSSPEQYKGGLGLPPGDRTAFPNSAIYFDDEHILATMFHGGLVKINLNSGECISVLNNLSHPHGIRRFKSGFVLTNTGKGSCLILDSSLKPEKEISFQDLPVDGIRGSSNEWLQQVIPLNDDLLVAIDSRRASIFIIDLGNEQIRTIPYPANWVMQEICPVNNEMARHLVF